MFESDCNYYVARSNFGSSNNIGRKLLRPRKRVLTKTLGLF